MKCCVRLCNVQLCVCVCVCVCVYIYIYILLVTENNVDVSGENLKIMRPFGATPLLKPL